MFCRAPTPHKMRPTLCRNGALHISHRFYAADHIPAFQGTFPHQSSEGHHRRMFARHLQVSIPPPKFFTCLDASLSAAFNFVIEKLANPVWGSFQALAILPPLSQWSPRRICSVPPHPVATGFLIPSPLSSSLTVEKWGMQLRLLPWGSMDQKMRLSFRQVFSVQMKSSCFGS